MGKPNRRERNETPRDRKPGEPNRAMRRAARKQDRAADRLPAGARVKPGHVITIQQGDVIMIARVDETVPDFEAGVVSIKMTPMEDSVHPHPLAFDPPYEGLATTEGNGFRHFWEKLQFAFNLPSPYDFPAVPELDDEDRQVLTDYVAACKKLATYSALSHSSSMTINWDGDEDTELASSIPDEEALVGSMTRFRQLHAQEANSFVTAAGRLQKALQGEADLKAVVTQWQKARGALMNRTISTVICDQLNPSPLPVDDPNRAPSAFQNVNPDKLMLAYNYGEYIHVGSGREELKRYERDEMTSTYYKFALLTSFAALAHLYFGFAVLCERALGDT